ncbi:8-amino-7-oxononanoate synthase [Fodinisporobacter ferrooxydans]|uniref:8-amino-7-ketopelargonate synthase n=1 Tax=Fodinisporobacter ferrooxydans TaxID=2901836 RepID=A0ABY4CQB6_9BACL|nr:8-amino-7-oxononanoate synthase [Alicyclobacillaceae bacterium MYW30-H2]
MDTIWKAELKEELEQLQKLSQKRKLTEVEAAEQPWLTINHRNLLNLSSNNYLGLAGDIRLKEAMIHAVREIGTGAAASRLIVGNYPLYEQTESALAKWKGAEAGLIFSSGYSANIGMISSIIGRDGIVFSDKLNHASIVDGVILSRSEHKRYRHNDFNHLETLLKQAPFHKRKLIVTDTVFSMDGDLAKLQDLVTLKERYHAILMVDEAHSSGIFGEHGEGLVHHMKLQDKVEIQMGTFSKALGCFGAYAVGDRWLMEYFTNKMRSFIYTTALPPAILGAIYAAIRIVPNEHQRRRTLFEHSEYFRNSLLQLGFNICGSETQIIPILIGPNDQTTEFSQRLLEEGIAGIPIRPPTVPMNQARIRFSLMATHKREDLDFAIEKISLVGKQIGMIGGHTW